MHKTANATKSAKTQVRPTLDELKSRAEALIPVMRDRAGPAEEARRLSDETIRDLYDAQLLQLFVPACYGGVEADWPAIVWCSRLVARGCASSGWMVSVVGGHTAITSRLSKECQDVIYESGPEKVVTTASAQTTGTIVKEDGGYRLNGVWRFGSGIDHADWVQVTGPCHNHPNPPDHNIFRATVPRNVVEVEDTWHVAGMRATGSKDLRFEDVFVADDWVVTSAENFGMHPPGADLSPSAYIFDVPFMPYFTNWMIGPVLGCAEGAYEEYVTATIARIGSMTGAKVAEQSTVQERLAESASEINCASLLFESIVETMHTAGLERRPLTPEELIVINRDRVYLTRLCMNAVQRLVKQMGAIGIYNTNPVQRHWRDISVMGSQMGVNWDLNMIPYGKWTLGLPTGNPLMGNAREKSSK